MPSNDAGNGRLQRSVSAAPGSIPGDFATPEHAPGLTPGPRFRRRHTDPGPDLLKVGLVGLGYWGPNLLRALIEVGGVHVSYICDLDPERLARFARRYPDTEPTADFEDVLADPEVDAVVIATPVFTHFDLSARALRAGKHVLVEKPLAPSSEQADELVDIAGANGLTLMCGQTFLYSPPVRAVKRLLDAGELGEIYFISSSRVNLGLHQRDVSVIWDLGPHDFSILLYWLQEMPESIVTTGRASIVRGIPDVVFMTLHFPSGVVANVELSWLAPSKLRRTAIVGSEKMVLYEDGIAEPLRVFDSGVVYKDPETFGEYHLSYRTGDILSPKLPATEPLAAEVSDFAARTHGGGEDLDTLDVAQRVVTLAEAAETSLKQGGARIPIVDPVVIR
jgi:predicted dehydrogenase